jgi:hypothetical protein
MPPLARKFVRPVARKVWQHLSAPMPSRRAGGSCVRRRCDASAAPSARRHANRRSGTGAFLSRRTVRPHPGQVKREHTWGITAQLKLPISFPPIDVQIRRLVERRKIQAFFFINLGTFESWRVPSGRAVNRFWIQFGRINRLALFNLSHQTRFYVLLRKKKREFRSGEDNSHALSSHERLSLGNRGDDRKQRSLNNSVTKHRTLRRYVVRRLSRPPSFGSHAVCGLQKPSRFPC